MYAAICHYSMSQRLREENWTLDRFVEEVKKLGVEGVDFHARYLGEPSKEKAEEILKATAKHDMIMAGLSLATNFNTEDADALKEQFDYVKSWLPFAKDIAAPTVRVFGGHVAREQLSDKAIMDAALNRVIEAMKVITSEAEKQNILLAIENHGGLPGTGEQQVRVIEAVDSPHLRATIDIGNYVRVGQEAHEGTAVAAKYAAYVHFKDFTKFPDDMVPWGWNNKACVPGDGAVDHGKCLRILRDAGYDGCVALEYEAEEKAQTAIPRAVKFMKEVMESMEVTA